MGGGIYGCSQVQALIKIQDFPLDSNTQKNETGPLSYTILKKINSKWMKDLNVKQETIETLEENTGSHLFDIRCSNFLLDMSPETRETEV